MNDNAFRTAKSIEGRRSPRAPMLNCPHCNSRTYARSSKSLSPTYREITFACADASCGHTFVASLSVLRTLSPSARPNPSVVLPIAPPRKPNERPANDDGRPNIPPAANDMICTEAG